MNEDRFKAYKKIRKTWGEIKPETRILKSKKAYNRNKAKEEFEDMLEEDEFYEED